MGSLARNEVSYSFLYRNRLISAFNLNFDFSLGGIPAQFTMICFDTYGFFSKTIFWAKKRFLAKTGF